MRDRIAEFFAEKTARRALLLIIFIGALALFWKLLPLLAFFVAFYRGLFFSAGILNRRFKWNRVPALLVVLAACAGLIVLVVWLSAGKVAKLVVETRDTLPERMAALREHPWYLEAKELLPDSEKLAESAQHYASGIAKSATTLGHLVLLALIGFVIAIIYFLDEPKVRLFSERIAGNTITGTLARWLAHLAEAITLTVQIQLIVAVSNTVLTLPILLFIGVPHVPALMVLIFISGLIPVVGNLLAGSLLVFLAFQAKGWLSLIHI